MSYSKDVLREMMEQRRPPRNLAFRSPRAYVTGYKGRPPRGNLLSALEKRKLAYTRNEPYKADKPGSLTPRGSRLQGRIARPTPNIGSNITQKGILALAGGTLLNFALEVYRFLRARATATATGFSLAFAAVLGALQALKGAYDKAIESLPLSEDKQSWMKANVTIVLISIAVFAGSAEAMRRAFPRIMKVLRNRRIAAEISDALDAGDETMARTILLDAIEDENVNISAIRNRLTDEEFERLYRDAL